MKASRIEKPFYILELNSTEAWTICRALEEYLKSIYGENPPNPSWNSVAQEILDQLGRLK